MDLRKVIRSLSAKEAHVLYWKVRGKTDREIADLAGQKYDWTRKYTRRLYERLGWKELPADEKGLRLVVEAKPIIDELVGKNPEILKNFPLDPPDEPLEEEKSLAERIRQSIEEQKKPKREEEPPEEPVVSPILQEEPAVVAPVVQPPEEPSTVPPSLQPIDRLPEQEKTPPPDPDLEQKTIPVEPKLEQEKPPETQPKIETATSNPRRLAIIGGITLGICCLIIAATAVLEIPRFLAKSTPAPTICTSSEHLGQMGMFAKVWFPGL
jgi:hypothetical protein